MSTSGQDTKLAMKIRILVGLFSIPSLLLAGMISTMALNGQFQEISYFEWVYSLTGFIAIYIALTGKRLF